VAIPAGLAGGVSCRLWIDLSQPLEGGTCRLKRPDFSRWMVHGGMPKAHERVYDHGTKKRPCRSSRLSGNVPDRSTWVKRGQQAPHSPVPESNGTETWAMAAVRTHGSRGSVFHRRTLRQAHEQEPGLNPEDCTCRVEPGVHIVPCTKKGNPKRKATRLGGTHLIWGGGSVIGNT